MLWGNQEPIELVHEVFERAEVAEEEQIARTPRALPNIWPDLRPKPKPLVVTEDDTFEKKAKGFRKGDRVMVSTHSSLSARRAEVRYIGQVPEIRPGFWLGVVYDEPIGKNDGSIFGTRYFTCNANCGSFLRPNVVKRDPRPPSSNSTDAQSLQQQGDEHSRKRSKKGKKSAEADSARAQEVPKTASAPPPPSNLPSEQTKGAGVDAATYNASVGAIDVASSESAAAEPAAAAAAAAVVAGETAETEALAVEQPPADEDGWLTSFFNSVVAIGEEGGADPGIASHADAPQKGQRSKAAWENAMMRTLTGMHLADGHDEEAVRHAMERRRKKKVMAKHSLLLAAEAAVRDKKRAAASASKALGPGLTTSIVRQLGTFTIIAHDHEGNRRLSGGELIAVAIRGTSNVRARLTDNGDGTYLASYRAWVSGTYEVAIWLNGEPLGGSPFALEVLSTRAEASKCELQGDGLNNAVSREPTTFEIEYVDAFGQVCYAEDLDVYVELLHSPRLPVSSSVRPPPLLREPEVQDAEMAQKGHAGDEIDVLEPSTDKSDAQGPAKGDPVPTLATPSTALVQGGGNAAASSKNPIEPRLLTIESFLEEGGGKPVDPELEVKTQRRPSILPQQIQAFRMTSSYQRLDAIERQQHMQLWARRRALDQASRMMKEAKKGASTKQVEQIDSVLNYDHELKGDKRGVGFAYGGVSPGTLHAKGQLIRVHTVHFSVGLAGKYLLHVGLRQQATALPGSPFQLTVKPGAAYAPSTRLPAEMLPLRGVVGEDWRGIVIFAADKVGNKCVAGGSNVKIHVDHEAVEAVCTDNGDGSYGFRWRSERAGTYSVSILIDEMPVVGSPTTLTMLAANLDVSNCGVSGSGLNNAVAGAPAVFRITCKDKYSNPATPATSLTFGLAITRVEQTAQDTIKSKKKLSQEAQEHNSLQKKQKNHEKDEEMRERKRRAAMEALHSMRFDGFWVDGEYEIRFMAEKAGDHQLHLWADPEGKGVREILPGSPFTLNVIENVASPKTSTIGIEEKPSEEKGFHAGEKLIVRPQLRDMYGNPSAAAPDALTAMADTPDGQLQLAVRPSSKGLGAYEVICETLLKGEYTLHVLLNGEALAGSPAIFMVHPAAANAGRSKLLPPVEPPTTNKSCELVLVAVDKLGNALDRGGARIDARVIGANASACVTEDKKDGTYTLTFTAGAMGEYRVNARLDNSEITPMTLQFVDAARRCSEDGDSRDGTPFGLRRAIDALPLRDTQGEGAPVAVPPVDIGSLADPKMPDAMVASKASSGSSSKRSSKASSALKAQAKKDSGRIHPSGEPEAVQTKRSTSPSSKVSKSSVRSSSPKPSERSPASSAGNGHRGKAAQRGKTFPPTPVMRKR